MWLLSLFMSNHVRARVPGPPSLPFVVSFVVGCSSLSLSLSHVLYERPSRWLTYMFPSQMYTDWEYTATVVTLLTRIHTHTHTRTLELPEYVISSHPSVYILIYSLPYLPAEHIHPLILDSLIYFWLSLIYLFFPSQHPLSLSLSLYNQNILSTMFTSAVCVCVWPVRIVKRLFHSL